MPIAAILSLEQQTVDIKQQCTFFCQLHLKMHGKKCFNSKISTFWEEKKKVTGLSDVAQIENLQKGIKKSRWVKFPSLEKYFEKDKQQESRGENLLQHSERK